MHVFLLILSGVCFIGSWVLLIAVKRESDRSAELLIKTKEHLKEAKRLLDT